MMKIGFAAGAGLSAALAAGRQGASAARPQIRAVERGSMEGIRDRDVDGNHPAGTAGTLSFQVGLSGAFLRGRGAHFFASLSKSRMILSTSASSGSKELPDQRTMSSCRSWSGSARASRNSS